MPRCEDCKAVVKPADAHIDFDLCHPCVAARWAAREPAPSPRKKDHPDYPRQRRAQRTHLQNLRRANQLRATPKWADKEKIAAIYSKRKEGEHVDHIVPLQGRTVCGLHVEENLRIIPAQDNVRKSNTHTF